MRPGQHTVQHSLTVPEAYHGYRLDHVIARLLPDYSRNLIKHWFQSGCIAYQGQIIKKPSTTAVSHQTIEINGWLPDEPTWAPQALTFEIIDQDSAFYIVNKPPGLVTHPAPNSPDQTLANALLNYDPQLQQIERAGIVHRLDKDTSGLLIIARTPAAQQQLIQQMKQRAIHRYYLALVHGHFQHKQGTIEAPIARHPKHRTQMAVVEDGKPGMTHYQVLETLPYHSLLKIKLDTGRTHQIRVHMAHIGHGIVGDPTYGKKRKQHQLPDFVRQAIKTFNRPALHACQLALHHPFNHQLLHWQAPCPDDFSQLIRTLRGNHE